ncbi:hypothetical protein DL89DRAFT_254716 [Linderina pennispora]|uniref:Uncharacterized protein n=1 Tax=Linderina pennispora TaxID=61395 RepID=A0A1Y1WN67_9FUNG|nr:uncharacterized protein DL89DRAFT_254716 [Linderina pennispora]ORX74953.1 hypothetical protein DL89DRAFT_254716 [Linderina pennispora]
MDLKNDLSRWMESPEDDDGDDYGLIIDHSLTEAALPPMPTLPVDMPRLRTPPPAAAQLGHLPPSAQLGLMPPSTQLSLMPPAVSPRSILPQNLPLIQPAAKKPQTLLDKYVENDDEDYNDLVLPNEADQLDSHLAALKTPRRRIPSWPRNSESLLSGATAVSPSKPASEKAAHSRPMSLGLGISTPENAHRVPSARQRVLEWQLKGKQEASHKPRRPMLIRNMSRGNEPVVIGCMRYDPVGRMWVGNDEEGTRISSAIAESDRQLRSRGLIRNEPLDSRKLARKISARSGGSPRSDEGEEPVDPKPRPVFDPQNLRWIDPNEHKGDPLHDPFWNIPDLPVDPARADKMRSRSRSEAVSMANVFALTDEQRQTFAHESKEYGAFARRWFPKTTAA